MSTLLVCLSFAVLITSCTARTPWAKPKNKGKNKNAYNSWPTASPSISPSGGGECEDSCTDNVERPNFCDYASYLWDDASTPLDERNNIGMAKYLSSANILKAASLMKLGKAYKLAFLAVNGQLALGTRQWYAALSHIDRVRGDPSVYYEWHENNQGKEVCGVGIGLLEQRLMTSAVGNSGTQFDGLGHVFYMNGGFGDIHNYLFFNGFRGDEIMKEYGTKYLSVADLPPFVTRAILLDVAGYEGVKVLPETYRVDTDVVNNVLQFQGMSVDDIEAGDVILLFTGWAEQHWWDGDAEFYYSREPGFTVDTVLNIFGPKKVLLLGADSGSVEFRQVGSAPRALHVHWMICHGGFLYENLNLIEWVTDARNGDAPYQGAFFWTPAQIDGGVGGLGTPTVVV